MLRLPSADPKYYTKSNTHRTEKDDDNQSVNVAAKRRVTVEGHTDNIGSDRYNDDLSARRAATVKTALVRDHGVDEALLSTAGYGERQPIETNETLSGRARNRRVELVCRKN